MKNLSISWRVALASGVMLLLLLVIAVTGVVTATNLGDDARDITGRRLAMYSAAGSLTVSVLQSARHTRNMLILDEDKVAAEVDSTRLQQQSRMEPMALMRSNVASPEGKALVAAVDAANTRYEGPERQYLELIVAKKKDEARLYLLGTMRPAQLEFLKAIEAFGGFQSRRMAESAAMMQRSAATARSTIVGISLASVVVALIVGAALARSIVRPIARAVSIAETVATGDLTVPIDVDRRDETGRLLAALKAMTASLLGVVSEVRDGSESIATGSSEIATGNADLSQRTEEQAANLQHTAASMGQIHGAVQGSAETAREASRLAVDASAAAVASGAVVAQFVGTMNDISTSSRRIADIIGTIDGIAFQTNILALNAAVEAARAGEQGRGFAVVATEVRSLAQRSADAAREIKSLIGASVEKVENGSALVARAGETMSGLVSQVDTVSRMIGEISVAATAQTTGIAQVNDAVSQLDQVTQQNAALVEQSAAAADSLRQQSERLVRSVATFKVRASDPVTA